MSKIAICISGLPRFFEKSQPLLKTHVLNNNDCDIFFHTWNVKDSVWQTEWDFHTKSDIEQELVELYKPKKYVYEMQRTNLTNKPISLYKNTLSKPSVMFSMFYSIWKVNELRKEYERENLIKYDYVLRTRFDAGVLSDVIFGNYSTNILHYSDSIKNPRVICDWFDFSSPNIMDIFCSVYEKLDEYYEKGVVFCGEELLTYMLKENNIQYTPEKISLFLIRDPQFSDKSHYGRIW